MINIITREAISILGTNPYDAAHGVPHHKAVWNNVLWIIREENLTVDREALEISAWWHDVDKGSTHDPRLPRSGGFRPRDHEGRESGIDRLVSSRLRIRLLASHQKNRFPVPPP